MNKQAAEKIATEYYNLGIQLALQQAGLIKKANKSGISNKVEGSKNWVPKHNKQQRGPKNKGNRVQKETWNPIRKNR